MSSYVASGIAGSNQTKTSLIAVRLGLVGFIIPFFFLGNPILLIGASDAGTFTILWACLTSIIGTIGLVAGLEGWMLTRCNYFERAVLIAASLLMIDPNTVTDFIGIAAVAVIVVSQVFKSKKTVAAA